jgi:hypothetical protein
MAGMKGNATLRDLPEDQSAVNETSQFDKMAMSAGKIRARPSNPFWAAKISEAVEGGLVSRQGIDTFLENNPDWGPVVETAYARYQRNAGQQKDVQGIVGKYINQGSPEIPAQPEKPFQTDMEQEFGLPGLRGNVEKYAQEGQAAIPAKRDYQGAVDALASNPAYLPYAKEYQELGGLKQGTGRGEYYVPIQTASGVKAFNSRTGKIEDASKLPVVGSASDPELQGKLSGAKEYGQGVGKESVDIDRIMDAQTSLKDAKDIFQERYLHLITCEYQERFCKTFTWCR